MVCAIIGVNTERVMRLRPCCRQLLLLASAFLVVLLLSGYSDWSAFPSVPGEALLQHPFWNYDLDAEEPRDPKQTCIIPQVHPLHPSVWSSIKPAKPIICKERSPWLTYVGADGVLRLNASAGYKLDSLRCSYQAVLRLTDNIIRLGPPVHFEKPTRINYSAISISCHNFLDFPIYSNIHPVVVPKPAATHGLAQPYNVLVFGLDSVSRLSMLRLLPKTYTYLTKVLECTVLRGMNKVGDNTFPNLVALLTGREAYTQIKHPHGTNETFDDLPLIWKEFAEIGYETLYAEDFPQFGTFNYLAEGFRDPPADHYLRPFWLAVEQSYLLRTSSNLCLGNVAKHRIQIDYLRQLITKQPLKRPYFAFSFLVEISHEYMQQTAAADEDFLHFFRHLHDGGFLRNTFLFFISDHGHRFDAIRETYVGHIEERLPFVAVRPPTEIDSELGSYVRAGLHAATGRLTSPYDTYETLRDILALVKTGKLATRTVSRFGRSLFGNIPAERTCADAGVPSKYCACDIEQPINIKDPLSQRIALALVDKVNELLARGLGSKSSLCAQLKLKTIRDANRVLSRPGESPQRVRVTVEVSPSGALLDGMLEVKEDGSVECTDDVSRINKYANQSACIDHEILRKYCYCESSKK
ncbi:uncharacterized protein LOC135391530 isoform X2 [Ornithodoros turicata]|uniref:uncharacterized protein LOC135391530 isoform X2 n=1 Tax=Ornithodoros turicata TaxID=34597 RepID=UPI003138A98C